MPDDLTFPVEAGHIMRFAAAIGDENPIYRDAAHARAAEPGSVIAPPTYAVVSSHWDPAVPRPLPGRPWRGSAAGPTGRPGGAGTGASARGLHAEQRYVYHRPVLAGETLSVRTRPGKTWDEGGTSRRQDDVQGDDQRVLRRGGRDRRHRHQRRRHHLARRRSVVSPR